ncbi:UDP-N-acetylmuramyl pentapeptide phosphotransferase/UDP-N-acetylglucosamine-1-phosphate transferase [Thermosyntropha lipolytica DSM 11003]|uniref:UDP-N-acetylmuramyl pentapeptide phosphotransferase/UDP-N-acetylglucosamine-1-phosphate transferase n=1 Tax=Thermosyntropha lipolytica DSM 11003 TaxID=1123382 RepID=A0A1M5J808_9FIRM|nr:hypothetical protein [Thermosyntropha lipolytica]SHG36714.1 UDP-N-acetylmuramyl pentapeptide phosphotransferase/UDP-N-acetylglucosamine-1-phosphate transferase [Thermosyntropha lipolytica DSM 11003]
MTTFYLMQVIPLLLGALAEGAVLFLLLNMLRETGATAKNFQGVDIPVSAGLSFPMALIIVVVIYELWGWYEDAYLLFIFGVVAISFLGFIDDRLGGRDTLGFKGHFSALFKGRLTTGGLKALGGGFISLFLALALSNGWYDIIINTLIIALFTNLLNLLDLRPGRAVKGFLFLGLIIAALARWQLNFLLILPVVGAVIVYFPVDLKARAMMGDAGSNVLGLVLGYLCVTSLDFPYRLGILVFLLAVHLYTEKYSLTETIEHSKVLKWLDDLGR